MAPSFLSKLVNKAAPTHTRERSDKSIDSVRSSSSRPRSRAPYYTAPPVPPLPSNLPPSPQQAGNDDQLTAAGGEEKEEEKSRVPTLITTNTAGEESGADSDSTFPKVTVVPPSPMQRNHYDLSRSNSERSLARSEDQRTDNVEDDSKRINSNGSTHSLNSKTPLASPTVESPTTPRPGASQRNKTETTHPHSRPTTPVASAEPTKQPMSSKTLDPAHEVRKQPSNRSINRPPPFTAETMQQINHARAATSPSQTRTSTEGQDGQTLVYGAKTPIVESPTTMRIPDYPNLSEPKVNAQQQNSVTTPSTSSTLLVSPQRDSDSVSLASVNDTTKEKKRPWRRSTTQRKPTGLASAIAASSLAMANHSLSAAQQAQLAAAANAVQSPISVSSRKLSSASGSPPHISRSASISSRHVKAKSVEMSPSSHRSGRRAGSMSIHSDDKSEYLPSEDNRPDYYSGLEDSSDEDGSSSDDDLRGLDLEQDMPVTGFAVASNKRNADFHELFSGIPEGDYLIDDYGCALQREILIQGRLYISENHVCFHANIFGWITDLSIPIHEITHLEKKMTAFVIPNAIQITTRQAKYTFASFLSRDTTFDVVHNIWKLERPDDASISSAGAISYEGHGMGALINGAIASAAKSTRCACGRDGQHLAETALEAVLPGTPEGIYNLIFASAFMKEFMAVNQKLTDIQISDWSPLVPGSKLLTRNMSYIKPLSGSLGPKQTKCELHDETMYCDFEDYVSMMTTTRTPEVPSGGVFAVKTRTCIMWASAVSTRIVVTTEVEWTGRSFIKGIIERSAIDGQKAYHSDLEQAMRLYIEEHQSEFVPEGIDPAVLSQAVTNATEGVEITVAQKLSQEEAMKKREHERNRRSLQWAWDTFDGAYQVAKRSTKGALELVSDAWEQSSTTTILYFVIVILVFSNMYTLVRSSRKDSRKMQRREEEREKWVQGMVTMLKGELGVAKANQAEQQQQLPLPPLGMPPVAATWREEVAQLLKTLDLADERMKSLRSKLSEGLLEQLD